MLMEKEKDKKSDQKNYKTEEGNAKKKEVSPLVMNNPRVVEIDENLTRDKNILSHRLCGAGGGAAGIPVDSWVAVASGGGSGSYAKIFITSNL